MTSRFVRAKGSRPLLEELEDQVLYSADALGGLDAVLVTNKDDTVLEAGLLPASNATEEVSAQQAAVSAEHEQVTRHEIVFVDTDTPDYQLLVDDLINQSNEDRQFDVFILDNTRDGIEQISEMLSGYDNLDAVHIISHGTDGSIDLGGSRLNVGSLNTSAADIGGWADVFTESGDFLIYGCNLAASADGQSFVNSLANLTGADVAASDDLTGSASLGGDWNLEYASGAVETGVAISASAQTIYEAVLDNPAVITGDVSFSGNEGDAVLGDMDASDVEGLTDATYYTVTSAATNGAAAIDPETGAWTFTPTDANWFGSDSFTVTVTDDLGGTTTQVVNITLANVDDAAVITGDVSFSGNEGDAVLGDMDASDVEGLTDATYYTVTSAATNGAAAIDPETGAWTFTPTDANWFGSDSFTVTVTDDLGGTTTQVVNITLANVDDAAVITGDVSFSGNEGDAVLGDMDASDVEGLTDATYYTVTSAATNGAAAIDPETGAWTFTPTDANWFGSDSFTVTVTDDLGGTTTQVVNITLANVDDAAVITGDVSFSGNEGDAVLGDMDASDVEGLTDATYYTVTSAATNGAAAIDPETGAWTFTPTDANWFGSDSFTVTVTDDLGGTTTQVVNITLANVDDAAVITGDVSFSGNEGDAVLGDMDASDVEGLTDATYYTVTSAATNGAAAIDPETGAWTFTPTDANWFGSDSFTVTVTDDLGGTTTQVVNITVNAVNDAPVNSVPTAQVTAEDSPIVFSTGNGNLISVSDIDAAAGNIELSLTVTHGVITLSGTTGLTFSSGNGTADLTMTFTGTVADVNVALDGMTFTPDSHYAGAARLAVLSNDLGNVGAGGALVAYDSIDITVTQDGSDDVPINSVPGVQFVDEDSRLILSALNSNGITVSDDAAGSSVEVTLTASNGTVTLTNTIGPEFLVNSTTANQQLEPVIAMAADDSYVVVWTSKDQDDADGKKGVYFQRYAADGTALGPETLVNQTTLDDQDAPAIAMDAAGNFVITWVSKDQDNVDDSDGVYARLFNADGTAVGNEFLVNQTTADDQSAPDVAMDDAGNFVIVWQSKGQDDVDGDWGVYARLFNAGGSPNGGEFLVNQTTLDEQLAPSVAMDADGDFVVAWQSKDQDGSGKGIYARQFDLNGTAQTNEFLVNQVTSGDQKAPDVAIDDAGNFVIAWESKGQDSVDGKKGIIARLYDNTATAQGNEFVVNSVVAGDQTAPVVTMNASGDFVVAWHSKNQDYADNRLGIYAQYFDATGTAQGDDFLVNQTTPLDQKLPSVALNSLGEAIAVWQSKDQDDPDGKEGIYGQYFLPPNTITITSGDGIDDSLVTFSGSLDHVNSVLDGIVFTPTPEFYGTASIQIDSDDGSNTGTDSFDITVNPVNDAPSNIIPGLQTTVESTPLTFSTGNGNALSIDDDAGLNAIEVTLTATHGVISLSGTSGLSFTTGDGSDDLSMIFTGTLADVNTALEGLVFTPVDSFTGNAYLRINTDDQGNTGGGTLTDTDTISIAVSADATNTAPVIAVPGGQNTPQDTTLLFSDTNGNAITLMDDADSNPVQLTLSASNGTLTLSPHIDSETQVNTHTEDDQLNSQVAVAADGSYIVVWQSDDQDGNGFGIFAQHYNPLGEPEGAEFQVNSATLNDQTEAAVSMNADGAFVIVWQSKNQDGSGFGVYGQLFDNSGTRVGGELEINTSIADDQSMPDVAMDDAGNFVVTWDSKGHDNLDLKTGIYAQRYDASGLALGDEFLVNTETLSDQNAPVIAMDSNGDFVIVWQSKDHDGDGFGIYGQRFNAAGDTQGSEFQVNTGTSKDQLAPDIAMDDAGNFIVVWQSVDQDGDGNGIYAQRYAANGATQGLEFLVNATTAEDQLAPSVAMQGSGEFVVAWASDRQDNPDNTLGIYVQRYDAGGVAQGGETLVNTTTQDDQRLPSVALDDNGNAIVSWSSTDQDNADGRDGVYLQRLPGVDAITYLTGDGVDDASIVLTGTVAQINEALDGMIFTPTAGFNGTAGVQIDVDDLGYSGSGGALTASDNLFITVGTADVAAPFQVNNTGSTLLEGATQLIDSATLRYDDAAQPAAAVTYTVTTIPTNGQLELTTDPGVAIASFTQAQVNANEVVYVHNGSESVADSFSFDIDDGSFNALSGQSFNLTITPVNDAPINNVPGQQNTDTDTALVFDSINGNLISLADDAGNSVVELTLSATNGLITLSGTTGLSFTVGDGSDDLNMTFTGTLGDINDALDSLIFDPNLAFSGTASLQLLTNDLGNTGGGALSDTDVITIEVGNYNQAPVISAPMMQGTVEDTALVFSTGNGNAISVVDGDAAGDDIQVTLTASNGTLTLGGVAGLNFIQGDGGGDPMMVFEGTVAEINTALEGLTFDAVTNYAGPAILQIRVNDLGNNGPGGAQIDAAVVEIDITPDATNDPPTLSMPGPQITQEDTPLHLVSSTGNLILVDDDSAVQVFDDAVLTPIEITISATGGTVSLGEVWGSEFAVNTHIDNHQTDPAVATAANGDYVVVWAGNNQDGNGYGIFGQRFSVNGLPLGGEFRINSEIVGNQIDPVVAMADDGSFVVAWTGKDADGTGVFGQRYSASGAELGSEFTINTTTAKDQATPAIAMDAAGNFVVVWHSGDQDGDGFGIYGQRYSNTGAAVGTEFSVNTETTKHQVNAAVAMDADGDFVVVWESENQDGDTWGIYGQRFDSSGTAQGSEFLINSRTLKVQLAPSVAMDDSGNFVVTWQSLQQDDLDKKYGVYAQRYDAAGTTLGAEFLVNTTTQQAQTAPIISMDGSGEFVIVWQSDDQDGDQEGIYGQRYAADGSTIGDEFQINTANAKAQTAPAVAISDNGTLVAVWSSDDQDGSNTGVFGQRFRTEWNQVFTVGDGTDDVTMTFNATVAEINDLLGGLVFNPGSGYSGVASLDVMLDDGANIVSASTPITVLAVNDAPTVTVPGSQNVTEGQSLVFSAAASNAITLADVDDGGSPVLVTLTGTGGTLTLAGVTGLSFSTGDGSTDPVMTFTGTLADINTALDGLSFSPLAGYTGPASLLVHIDDQGNTGAGGALTASNTVYVSVDSDAVNDAPVNSLPGPQETGRNVPLQLSIANDNAVWITDDSGANEIELTLTATNGSVSLSDGAGTEIAVNTTTSSEQMASQVAVAPNGEFVVVWQSNNQDGAGYGIFGQRFNAFGQPLGSEFQVNSTSANHQIAPVVAMDTNGNFVVAWQSENQDGSGMGIVLQRFAANGTALGGELLVNTTVADHQTNPVIAMADDGRFVVVWESKNQDGAGIGIYGQLYAANGSVFGDEFLINTTTADNQTAAAVAMNAAGEFVVTWQSTDANGQGIFGQRFNADGLMVDSEFAVNNTTTKDQTATSVALNTDGSFVVVWQSQDQDGDREGIYAQAYDAAGLQSGAEFLVNSHTAKDQVAPQVSVNDEGEYVVVWQSADQDGDGAGVFGQVFDAAGTLIGDEFLISTATTKDQTAPAVVAYGTGNFVTTWTSDGQDGDKRGVYVQRHLDPQGLNFISGDGTDDSLIVVRGTVEALNAALGGMEFTPDLDYQGAASIRVQVNDLGNTGFGGAQTDDDTIDIIVDGGPLIDLDDDDSSGASGSAFQADFIWTGASAPVLVTDTDAFISDINDGNLQSLTVTLVNRPDGAFENLTADTTGTSIVLTAYNPATGVLTLSGNEAIADYEQVLRTLSYDNTDADPDESQRIITFVANDGTYDSNVATTYLTVSGPNDAPVATIPGAQVMLEDAALVFSTGNANAISISDEDANGAAVQVTLNTAGGTLTLGSTNRLDSVVGDGTGNVVLIGTVNVINEALEGLRFDPTAHLAGATSIGILVDDLGNTGDGGAKTDNESIAVTITPVNDEPGLSPLSDQVVNEDTGAHTVAGFATSAAAGGADEAGQTFSYNVSNDNSSLFSVGPAIDASGTLTYTLAANAHGTATVTVSVTDSGGTANGGDNTSTDQTFDITINPIDDAAVITGDISFSGNEGDAVLGDLDATDVDGLTDSTYFTVSSAATNGTAAIDATTGAWTFTPTDSNWSGSDSFTVTVTDDLGGTTNQIVSITLANVDDPAVITGDVSFIGNEGDAVLGDLNATDAEGLTDGTYFTVSSAAANGTAAINAATGAWTFTPTDPNWFGSDNFTVTVTDDLGGTTNQVVSITLANVDDAAVISGDVSFTGNEGDAVLGDLNATDAEGLTDGTYFTVSSVATNGTAAIDATTGAWTFTPTDPNWFGSDSFTVTVTDDLGGTTNQVVNITLTNVDDAAVISGDVSFTGNEGDAVLGDLNATDVDGLSDGTYFTVSSAATNGTAAIDATTGAWTFTPADSDWFGSDSFTVTVTDDLGGTANQIVSITLANVDDSAVITGDISFSGNEGDAVLGDLNATDVEGLTDGTYFTVSSAATNGSAAIDATTGAWTFTPTDSNWFGSDSFSVTVTDDLGGTTNQVISITLVNVDDAAVISGDVSFTGNEGDAVLGDLNATDVEGLTDGTYFSVSSVATHGTAAINATTGAWTFTPTDANWFGSDSFTVTVMDDLGGTTNQVVSITLANVDDSATITGDVSFVGNEGDAVLGDLNVTDVDGLSDGTYFTVSSAAANGAAAIDATTGAWTFTPTDSNWFGSDSFTVTVTDDLGGTTNQIVNITLANVDDSATITGDVSFVGNEGDAVLGDLNATDVEGLTDGTYFTVSSAAANGTAAIDATTGAWTFTPTDPNWFGSDSFTVTVTDDLGGTTNQVVSITLANVDDAAVISGDVSFTGNEGDAVLGDLNATDVEGLTDGTYFTVSSAGTNGTAAIDATTGAWTFTPTDSNWFGSDSFTVTVTDDLGGTTNQVVSITLANVDDAAVISGDVSFTGNEGDAVLGDLNATDVDGLTDSTYFTVSSAAANGAAAIDATTGAWTFTPTDSNWFGSDSFTVTVTDDQGGITNQIVSITLANVDDAAVITGDINYTGSEGDAVSGDMDATDVEGLTDGTYFTVSSAAANGTAAIDATTGAWTFTPTDPNWFGSDSFTVTVTDDLGGTTNQVVSITLANIDDSATITGDASFVGNEGDIVLGDLNATDVDGLTDGTYFTVSSAATNGAAVINATTGAWTFTPTDSNWFGSDSFTVTVTDDVGGTTNQVVSITLANVDDAAVITGDVSFTGNEGDAVLGDLNATDVEGLTDGAYFTVSSAASNGTAAINATTGAWTFTPTDSNWFGSDNFTVTVTDDLGGTTNQVVNITLTNVDDAAVISGDVSFTGNEGDAVLGDLNATDVDGLTDSTYFTVSSAATNGTAAINATTGSWTFTPTDSNWFGSDSFTITVTDDQGGTTNQVVSITLANVDDAAVISGDVSFTGNEGDAVLGDLNATDADGLADSTYFTVTSAATNGTAAIDATTGAWTFTPTDTNWFGSDSFTVTVTDDQGGATNQIVNITLANVDDSATITGDVSFVGNEGDAVLGDLNATDVDGLTDGTYFTVSSAATNGTAAIDATTGAWTFAPTDSNWFGSDSFTVTVTDDLGGTTDQVVSITLANVDDAAVITGDVGFTGNEGDAVLGDLNATDVEGLTDGTYFAVTSAATNGVAAIDTTTGAWTFTPTDSNWFGSDSFTVTVTDDLGGTTDQVVSITLANVDDATVITGDVSFGGNEGDAVFGDLNATDVEGLTDGTYFAVTSAATNGVAAIDTTTGAWTFTPTDPNWFGSDSFTVTVSDDLGGTTDQVVSITLANVDDATVITGDVSFSGNEGDAVLGDLNATDIEGLTDGTYFTVTSAATNGVAAIDATTGAWTFTPTDSNWFGSDSFTVTVTDDLGGTTDQVVSITLANVDDPAIISGDVSYTGSEGDAVLGDLDAIDVDGLTDGAYFTVTAAATNGVAAIDATTGAWTFTPTDANWFGSDSFTVTVTDDAGGTTDQLVSITLASVDDAAVITGDTSYAGNEADAVSGDMDATDVEGLTDGTYFTVTSAATNGVAAIDGTTGAWTFTPTDPNWFGSDSFTVTVTDDLGGTTDQVVSITLANVDDPAIISGDVSYIGNEGDAALGDLDATDVDGLTDGTYFTVTSTATNGVATIDATTGVWTFTPTDANWFGSDSFTVTITDDVGGTTNQIVNITLANIDDPAIISGDVSYTGNEGDAVSGDMDATDVDGLTDGAYFTVISAATNGTAAIDATTGAWTFTPTDPNWFGSDSFTVTVTDDLGGTTNQVVNITLANVDDAATITGNVSFVGNEGDAVLGDLNANDVEGLTDGTYFTVSAAATNGTAAIDATTGAWTFTPTDSNWFGSDNFTVTVTDDLGGTTNQVVNITLTNVDDAAVISGDVSFTGNEGDAVLGDLNATDEDGLTDSTYFGVSSAATNGTAAINATTGAWTFTPTDSNWFGSDSFTVTVTDDQGGTTNQIVSIILANVDDAAVITGDISYTGNEGDAVSGDMDATDSEGLADGTVFTVSTAATNGTTTIDPATGVWTFTPTDANWFGSDSFTVAVTDDLGGTTNQLVSITLANVDDAAVITGDISYTGNEGDAVSGDMDATDIEGLTDGTVFSVTSAAANGVVAIDPGTGAWTFTPTDSNWFGSDSFTVTVTDDLGGAANQIVSITLANVDDPAVISGDVNYTGNENDAVAGDMDVTDVDGLSDGTVFTVSAAATNGTAAIDPATGVWTFTPTDANWFGSDGFTVTVTDDQGGTTSQIVSITLASVDDAAIISGDVNYTANEGDVVLGNLNATDVEGLTDGTYFTVSSAATNGTAAIDATTGAWTFTPTDANWFGSDSFTVTVTDDLGGTTNQIVSIILINVDDTAMITGDIGYAGNEGDLIGGDLNATDIEGIADGTVFTVSAAASHGTAAIDPATGVWTFIPTDSNWFGSDSFTVTVTDDLGGATNQIMSITVTNVDDTAVITGDIGYAGNEGDVVGGDLNAADMEGLADGTVFTVSAAATNGTAVIDPATGAWSFTQTDSNWFGSDSITVTVTDDLGGTTNQVVSITLANVDDAAVITGDISFSGNEGDAIDGDLNVTDIEGLTDGTVFSVTSPAINGTATINPATGVWTFASTDANWFGSDQFTVTITDDLGGTSTQVVNITLANVDDPTIVSGVDTGAVTEDIGVINGELRASGTLTITDPDVGESTFEAATIAGSYGLLSTDSSGNWSFVTNNSDAAIQALDEGETLVDTLTVTTASGVTHDVVIAITGVEDASVITGSVSATTLNNSVDATRGWLSIHDVDASDGSPSFNEVDATLGDNGYGQFELTADAWAYTLNNTHSAVLLLEVGETLQDTFEFTASDGSTKMVTVTIEGAPDGTVDIEATDAEVAGNDDPDAYEWLSEVVAVASAPADNSESSDSNNGDAPISDETGDTDVVSIVDLTESFTAPLAVEAFGPVVHQAAVTATPLERRDEKRVDGVVDDAEFLRTVLVEANTEIDAIDVADEIPLVGEQANRHSLRHATQIMRDEMSNADEDLRFAERITDISLRVSGTAISAGSLAWLLRGASLFASALSSIPTWKGFDPLPVLDKARSSKKKRTEEDLNTAQHEEEEQEAAVERVLGSVNDTGETEKHINRNKEGQ